MGSAAASAALRAGLGVKVLLMAAVNVAKSHCGSDRWVCPFSRSKAFSFAAAWMNAAVEAPVSAVAHATMSWSAAFKLTANCVMAFRVEMVYADANRLSYGMCNPSSSRLIIGMLSWCLRFSTSHTRPIVPMKGPSFFWVSPCYSILNLMASMLICLPDIDKLPTMTI